MNLSPMQLAQQELDAATQAYTALWEDADKHNRLAFGPGRELGEARQRLVKAEQEVERQKHLLLQRPAAPPAYDPFRRRA